MSSRKIIHIDLDAFYCAVEELFNPDLRGKPFAVGGRPESRGVVSSCSYAARSKGVRSALPMSRAVALCPDLIILPGRHREYAKKSQQVMSILKQTTEMIEQISIDEAFLDVSGTQQDPTSLARSIQSEILKRCNLPCSLGIASNKLVAKIATDVGKASVKTDTYPNAVMVVPEGEEAAFLAPLPLETLWGIGPKTAQNLRQTGIHNIGELARWPIEDLVSRLGKVGYDLHSRANGIDHRSIETYREPKSYSQEITFDKDTNSPKILLDQIKKQSLRISKSLVKANLNCTTVKIKLRWPDFSTISRQATLTLPTNDAEIIFEQAKNLFQKNWNKKTPIRLIGVGVSGLHPPSRQISLWDKIDYTKLAQLEAAIHEVKSKFGDQSIQKGFQTLNSEKNNPMTQNNKKTSKQTRSGIGTLNENSLHAEIINSIAQPGDRLEAEVEGYYIDILREDKAIEVQTRNIGKITKKVHTLAEIIPVEIIFPIQKLKYITKISADGKKTSQRKSPKQGRITDIFDELVRATTIIDHPSVSFTVLLIEAEEIWKDDGLGSWRRKGWSISERNLIKIFSSQTFYTPNDFLKLLPRSLPSPFTNLQLAESLGVRPRSAGKITYTLRKMSVLEQVGKHGNSYLFEII